MKLLIRSALYGASSLFLSRLVGLPLLAMVATDGVQAQVQGQTHKPLKIIAWGSDPTKAALPFSHGLALAEVHEVQMGLQDDSGSACGPIGSSYG
jgi:hypothetical protein